MTYRDKRRSADADRLPTYQETINASKSQRESSSADKTRKSDDPSPSSASLNPIASTALSKTTVLLWRLAIILPFLAAGCLLYLLTCSASSWRADWSVLQIGLSSDTFSKLYDQGTTVSGASAEASNSSTSAVSAVFNIFDSTSVSSAALSSATAIAQTVRSSSIMPRNSESASGYLTLNMWGWCVRSSDAEKTVCSSVSMWYDLHALLDSAGTDLTANDFNAVLIHGLLLHGLAMLAAMMAALPIGLTTWRIYRAKVAQFQGNWLEYGTLLGAIVLGLISWIIDRCLVASVSSKLSDETVQAGLATLIIGVTTILLFVTFLLSAIPVLYFHMRRQSQLIKYWKDLEDYDTAVSRDLESEEKREGGGGKRRGRDRGRNRLTRMIFGDESEEEVRRKKRRDRRETRRSKRRDAREWRRRRR